MSWWMWLLAGGALMAIELLGGEAAFYLVFIGLAAVLVGVAEMSGLALPYWAQWLLFSVVAVVTMVLFRKKLYDKVRGGSPGYTEMAVNELVTLPEDLAPHARTRVERRGSHYTAENVGDDVIPAGDARIVRVTGILLEVVGPATASNDATTTT